MLNVSYSNGTIYITNTSLTVDGIIEIYDFKGRKIYKCDVSKFNGNDIKIKSNAFAGGVYHIQLITKERRASAKFIITR